MERNITLDYFKIVLCVLVVFIHITGYLFITDTDWMVMLFKRITRIAVPCFFIINGYYLYNKITNKSDIFKAIAKYLQNYLVWTSLFMVFSFYEPSILKSVYIFLGIYHLWYLPALIIGVAILYLLKRFVANNNFILLLAICLFLTGCYIEHRGGFFSNTNLNSFTYRNALFVGFPFIFVGYYIRCFQDKINDIDKRYILSILFIVFVTFLFDFKYSTNKEVFLSLILICPAIFIAVLRYSKYAVDSGYIGMIATSVFYVHPIAIRFTEQFIYNSESFRIYSIPLILLFSVILAALTIELNKRIKIFF